MCCRKQKIEEKGKTPPLDLYPTLWEYTVRLMAGEGTYATRDRDYFKKTTIG